MLYLKALAILCGILWGIYALAMFAVHLWQRRVPPKIKALVAHALIGVHVISALILLCLFIYAVLGLVWGAP